MNNDLKKYKKDLEWWFFWFWVTRYKVSYLFIFLILFLWLFSLYTIPKESSPDIKFGIVWITTVYNWVNPQDIDSLITEKIENEVEDIDGIKKITSTSSVWVSSITIEFENTVDVKDALIDVRDAVDKVSLPEDSNDPLVTELSTSNELMFEVLLYWDSDTFSKYDLKQKAQKIKSLLEWNISWLSWIDLWWAQLNIWWSSNESDYEILVLLEKNKLEQLWLSIWEISNLIKANNKNTPIWNFSIWELNYDFRFDGELEDIEALKNIIIRYNNWSYITLGDVSSIERKYNNDTIKRLWFEWSKWFNYTSLSFNKSKWSNIFNVSKNSKHELDKILSSNIEFDWIKTYYINDLSEIIKEDYWNLSTTAIQTLVLVFITILIFVWFRESLIASMLLPLAFLITFYVLDSIGLSLNFLTNFSLVLTLWIAIDTVIVIIEWASEKMSQWYSRKYAILLAVKEFKSPLISWTLTTLVAFLPLMFLPWVVWKFLAYIPITVFSTLVAALFLSLTLSSALFISFVKSKKTFHVDKKSEESFSETEKLFLESQRKIKQEVKEDNKSIREKILWFIWSLYYSKLEFIISKLYRKVIVITLPIFLLLLSFIFLSPKIWFVLFPSSDEWVINVSIEGKSWLNEEFMSQYLDVIDESIIDTKELKVYTVDISWNTISIYIELINKNIRKDLWLKSVFEVEDDIYTKLSKLESYGLNVSIKTISNWPPTWKAVWIKLIANNSNKVLELKKVAKDFESYFKTIDWTKNVSMSSKDTPGQFIFTIDNDKLVSIWLNPNDILWELYQYTNWIKSSSIKSEFEDNDIVLKIWEFDDSLSPTQIQDLYINTRIWNIRVWDYVNYDFSNAVSTINRESWNISITVESDLDFWFLPTEVQPLLNEYAKSYNYPSGISFTTWWENVENAELIQSTIKSLFISMFLIFSILVFQFNSFRQPLIVLYSVLLALLGVNIWLFITWNPYSMPFMIWFIALTWVVVNDAIILIDRMNNNIEKWMDKLHAIVSAGKSRLQPIIVTTLTTVFWVLPLALQDEFWAWLGFTIIFGLIAWSTMTLFVIPTLYSMLYKKDKED